jgi:hypothetical protein
VIRGQLTKKANVYSFGVLMLEIISGRCHTDPRPPLEDQYLLEKVKNNGEINRYFIDFIPMTHLGPVPHYLANIDNH